MAENHRKGEKMKAEVYHIGGLEHLQTYLRNATNSNLIGEIEAAHITKGEIAKWLLESETQYIIAVEDSLIVHNQKIAISNCGDVYIIEVSE